MEEQYLGIVNASYKVHIYVNNDLLLFFITRSSIREFLASEAMAALGIPTTRALSLVSSAEKVSNYFIFFVRVLTQMYYTRQRGMNFIMEV